MEDILYISNYIKENLLKYCTEDLINYVLEDFGRNHEIVERNEKPPFATWVIDNYINERPINNRRKILAVILSFAALDGVVRLRGINCQGDVPLLCALRDNRLISEEDREFFIASFFNFSQGRGNRFTLND